VTLFLGQLARYFAAATYLSVAINLANRDSLWTPLNVTYIPRYKLEHVRVYHEYLNYSVVNVVSVTQLSSSTYSSLQNFKHYRVTREIVGLL
jgi:hypothetical protein